MNIVLNPDIRTTGLPEIFDSMMIRRLGRLYPNAGFKYTRDGLEIVISVHGINSKFANPSEATAYIKNAESISL